MNIVNIVRRFAIKTALIVGLFCVTAFPCFAGSSWFSPASSGGGSDTLQTVATRGATYTGNIGIGTTDVSSQQLNVKNVASGSTVIKTIALPVNTSLYNPNGNLTGYDNANHQLFALGGINDGTSIFPTLFLKGTTGGDNPAGRIVASNGVTSWEMLFSTNIHLGGTGTSGGINITRGTGDIYTPSAFTFNASPGLLNADYGLNVTANAGDITTTGSGQFNWRRKSDNATIASLTQDANLSLSGRDIVPTGCGGSPAGDCTVFTSSTCSDNNNHNSACYLTFTSCSNNSDTCTGTPSYYCAGWTNDADCNADSYCDWDYGGSVCNPKPCTTWDSDSTACVNAGCSYLDCPSFDESNCVGHGMDCTAHYDACAGSISTCSGEDIGDCALLGCTYDSGSHVNSTVQADKAIVNYNCIQMTRPDTTVVNCCVDNSNNYTCS